MLVRRERWVKVPGFGDMYRISSLGRVWSLHDSRRHRNKPHFVKPGRNTWGYHFVPLRFEKRTTNVSLGKLLLTCFKGPPVPPRIWACHNDGNPDNNNINNLRWGTNSENQMDRVRHGTSNRGSANGQSKLSEEDVISIKTRIKAGEPNKSIAIDYPHLDSSMVSMIRTGRHWAHVEI
jgi:hypothetical protein